MKPVKKKPGKKSGLIYLVTTVILTASVIVLLITKGNQDQDFPKLPIGEYAGTVQGLFLRDSGSEDGSKEGSKDSIEQSVPIYIEVKENILVTLLRDGWMPAVKEISKSDKQGPLELRGSEARLRFSGSMKEEGKFEGVVYNLDHNTKGSWSLSALDLKEGLPLTQERKNEIARVLLLRDELSLVEDQIDDVDAEIQKQIVAVKKFEEFVSDGTTLQQRTKEKYERAVAIYESENKIFNKKKKEARELAKQLALSERVTESGNLVSLSRKTIERENRWLDSMFETSSTKTPSYDFDSEVERAKKIIMLRGKLQIIKATKINEVAVDDSRGRLRDGTPKTGPVGSIWEMLQ